jgi:hypothetical protein
MTDLYDVHNAQFTQPTPDEIDASLRASFGMSDTPQPDHDPNDPVAVSAALMEPFPAAAIFKDDKGMQYVKYQQVLRRLMRATGNRFDIDVLDQRITPHGTTKSGVDKFLILATVKLTIPVLQSSRTQIGVQVAMANTEDLFKGAVSDGIKKCAQSFGVAIELAGDDRELAAAHASESPGAPQRPARLSQVQSHQPAQNDAQQPAQAPTGNRQFAPAQPGTGGPATDGQKRALWAISGQSKETIDQWAGEYGESNANLTKGTASVLIDAHGSK